MLIKTFAAEIADSTDLELNVIYETLSAARIASAHMVETWGILSAMVEATGAELIKRGLKLPVFDNAGAFFDASWRRAADLGISDAHRTKLV